MHALAQQQRSPVHLPATNGPIPRTHVMFSHTAKGQPYNTGLLAQFASPSDGLIGSPAAEFEKTLELWPRLIDYELLTNDEGKRTVGFGWFAGGSFKLPPYFASVIWVSRVVKMTYVNFLVAGVLESLSAMAHAHLELGIASPFLVSSCSFPPSKALACISLVAVEFCLT